jgi:hypothetical protein
VIEVILGIFLVLVSLWAAYSLICIVIPLKPFSTRGRATRSFGLSLLAFFAGGIVLGVLAPSDASKTAGTSGLPTESGSVLTANTRIAASIPDSCGEGGLALGDVVAVTGNHLLRASASATAPKIKNEKASRVLGEDHYHQIDHSTTVRRLCAQSEWTEVQIVTPDWLTHVRGWVPNDALREIERTASGKRVYVEDDFYWDDDTTQFKPQIVAVVNKIASENRNCGEIDTASVAKSPSRSKPNDPVFFVTCGSGANAFNVWFRPTDANSGQAFVANEPLAKSAAIDICEMAAKSAATHPSTVEFSRIWDLAYLPHVSGRTRVVSSFTAKNALNLELKYRISCLFDGPTLIETQISERFD